MKTALVGSSGYIAQFILKRFAIEPKIDSVLKLDKKVKLTFILASLPYEV